MSNQSKMSKEAFLPELDLFTIPPVQKSIERSFEVQYRPVSILGTSKVLDFIIPTSQNEYLLLHETYLYMKTQLIIEKPGEKEITDEDWNGIIPANNFLHSMIKQVQIEIAGKEITMANSTYAYRAYLENLLGFSKAAKHSHLSTALWYDDERQRSNAFKPAVVTEKESAVVDLYGRLHLDLTFQGKALLGGKQLIVKILLHDPDFYLTYGTAVRNVNLKVIDASIYAHKLIANETLVSAHAKALAITPARYPITRVDLRQATIPANSNDAILDNIVTGQLPRRIFVVMVSNSAFNGHSTEKPFYFDHFNLSHMACYVDGVQYPANPYSPDFKRNLYVREYSGLFQALNMNTTDTTVCITRKDFVAGKSIFAFNFAPDLSHGSGMSGYVNPIKRGSLRLNLRFAESTRMPITVLMYCEFDNLIEVDVERNVTTDFK